MDTRKTDVSHYGETYFTRKTTIKYLRLDKGQHFADILISEQFGHAPNDFANRKFSVIFGQGKEIQMFCFKHILFM